jgi:dCTP deaminase
MSWHFISIKASKKISGLVNVSGFHVDPGFRGLLKFSVYNAGSESIILGIGERLFPIWFYQLPEENEDEYSGRHKGQMSITPEDVMQLQGAVASPAALKKEIDDLRLDCDELEGSDYGCVGYGNRHGACRHLRSCHKAREVSDSRRLPVS